MKPVHFLSLVALLLAGCTRHSESTTASTLSAVPVKLVTVRAEPVPALTEITGLIRPVQRAQLAAKIMGSIEEMPLTLGQSVHAGDLLVKISAGEISARLAQARSQSNAAQRDLDRERALLAKGASTADLVKSLEDRFTGVEAVVHEAETMLAYTTIRAPFDGVISRKMVNPGDLASPGVPLLEIEGTTDFQVEAGIPDSLAPRLAPGAPLAVTVPAAGVTFTGKVAEISSAADAMALTVSAKIAIPAGVAVRSGQFARLEIPGEPVAMILVPSSSVSSVGQMQRVFVAEPDGPSVSPGRVGTSSPAATPFRTVLRLVKTGATHGDQIEILAGLSRDEHVIIDPPLDLREGQRLAIE